VLPVQAGGGGDGGTQGEGLHASRRRRLLLRWRSWLIRCIGERWPPGGLTSGWAWQLLQAATQPRRRLLARARRSATCHAQLAPATRRPLLLLQQSRHIHRYVADRRQPQRRVLLHASNCCRRWAADPTAAAAAAGASRGTPAAAAAAMTNDAGPAAAGARRGGPAAAAAAAPAAAGASIGGRGRLVKTLHLLQLPTSGQIPPLHVPAWARHG
jgi:hypothetical protein